MNNKKVTFDVKENIPQKEAMSLIHGMATKGKKKVVLSLTVSSDNIFVAPNKVVAPPALIEMLAQLCASNFAFKGGGKKAGQVRGYLAGIDKVKFSELVKAGDELDLIIWNVIKLDNFHRIQGQVFRGGSLVTQAQLTLCEVDEWKASDAKQDPLGERRPVLRGTSDDFQTSDKDKVGQGILHSLINVDIKPGDAAEATICFGPDFIGFSGHFPGYPVLPAVVILYTGWVLAELCHHHKLNLLSIGKAKFSRPIHPGDEMKVKFRVLPGENTRWRRSGVKMMCAGELVAKYELETEPA